MYICQRLQLYVNLPGVVTGAAVVVWVNLGLTFCGVVVPISGVVVLTGGLMVVVRGTGLAAVLAIRMGTVVV